jgi:hypothetical protein
MGTVAQDSQLEATRRLLIAYLETLGHEADKAEGLPLSSGFIEARRILDEQLGIEPPELPAGECLLEWNGGRSEGICESKGLISGFVPDGDDELPEPSTEVRLRIPGGSMRMLVLAKDGRRLSLGRAPHRQERRLHKRTVTSGFAVARVGGIEGNLNLADISEGGVSLGGEMLIEVGQHLDLLLRLEGKSSLSFECEGLVVNCRKPMSDRHLDRWLGVQFTSLPDGIRDEIRRYVRDQATS